MAVRMVFVFPCIIPVYVLYTTIIQYMIEPPNCAGIFLSVIRTINSIHLFLFCLFHSLLILLLFGVVLIISYALYASILL